MTLAAGTRLGPYEIVALLGQGGMGEVYRARDSRLGRDVAIKVAHRNFSERFEREARAIAALNHPNICTLYDVGPNYLVMELVEGETLAGPLPAAEVMRVARQIGEALMAAHDANIIHRDLKPANIKIRPDGLVKVLDFGLAGLVTPDSTDPSVTVTVMTAPTIAGTIIGSAPWMSPEQARGQKTDKRTDIWAFGVVLYEISTGVRLFTGDTLSDTIVQVLTKGPDLSLLPPELEPLVSWCLERDASKRLRDIADARPWLDPGSLPVRKPEGEAGAEPARKSSPWWQLAAAVALLAAVGIAGVHFREKPAPAAEMMRFQIRLPDGVRFEPGGTVTLAPDGRRIAFPGVTPEGYRIFVQDLDGGTARALANPRISGATPPFSWSPDSAYIAYSASGSTINKVEASTGVVETICQKPGPAVGGAWSREGIFIFGSTTTGLWRVATTGGTAERLTRLDTSRKETGHQLPVFLPDEKHYLFLAVSSDAEKSGIFARSLDDAPGKPSRLVMNTEFGSRFVPGPDRKSGWLLYLRAGTLTAQPFDLEKLALTGNPVTLTAKVGTAYQTALFSASPSVLVYRSGGLSQRTQLTWVDGKTGKDVGTAGDAGAISEPRLSPDEKRVVYLKDDENLNNKDIWILDLERGSSARLTYGGAHDLPVWSPDSSQVAYGKRVNGVSWQIFRKKADGSGPEESVLNLPGESVAPTDWSRDGRFLIFVKSLTAGSNLDTLAALALGSGQTPVPLSATTGFSEAMGRLSPDGHYLAYYSNETGRNEIYVRTFAPDAGGQPAGKWLVSNNGGQSPQWTADGKKLVWSVQGVIYGASIDTAHGFRAGVPEQMYPATGGIEAAATLTSKGQGLLLKPVGQAAGEPINVMVNWMSAIKPN